jgi:crotonobetainyl-CoA:carnitine CoA-transferase CaiB-like acyl-CoA transferase
VANDDLWQRFCTAAERPDLAADARFAKASDRVRNRETLVPLVRSVVKERTRDDWLERLDKAGVPSGAIRTVGEVCESEVLKARDMVAEMSHASAGTVKAIKSPMHLSETPLLSYAPPPRLGEHTREILTGLLGYSGGDCEQLARDKVV